MGLFRVTRSKKSFSLIRVISAVLVLGLLVVAVAESAKYLYVARLPKSVSTKIEPSVNKLAAVLGVAKTSLASLDKLGSVLVDDEERSTATSIKSSDSTRDQGENRDQPAQKAQVVVKLALLSDSHNDLEYLEKALVKAKDYGVNEVIVLGDYTDWGELANLQKSKEVMDTSQLPYVSLPGDHDLGETRDESNFVKVFGDTYGTLEFDNIKVVYFDNSKNFTSISDSAIAWFAKEIKDANFLFLSQPLATASMSRVMGIVDGVRDEEVFAQNKELLSEVRNSNVRVIVSGDLHQFSQYKDPVKEDLWHYSVGAVLKSQSLEKLNLQSPRFAVLTIRKDLSYEIVDVPID